MRRRDNIKQATLFPYVNGGQALILCVKIERMLIPLKESKAVKIVEFLFNGKIYIETFDSFLEHATKVKE